MKAFHIALATALLATGGAATAQTTSDAQCLVVSNAFAGQAKEPNQQKLAEAAVYFYLGRVANTMTTAQLKTLLEAQVKTLTSANAGEIMNKCAATIQSKVEMLKSMAGPAAKPAATKPAATKPTPTR